MGVELLDVTLPGVASVGRVYNEDVETPDPFVDPVAGAVLDDSERLNGYVQLTFAARCPSPRTLDRVVVRMRVLGREVDQVVRFAPVTAAC